MELTADPIPETVLEHGVPKGNVYSLDDKGGYMAHPVPKDQADVDAIAGLVKDATGNIAVKLFFHADDFATFSAA